MQATSSATRASRWLAAAVLALLVPAASLHAQVVPAPASGFSALQGSVMDSVHNAPLANANVIVEGTTRAAVTSADGHFHIDSIPAGPHRVSVMHALLDTLGVLMRTPAYPFVAGQTHDLDLALPGGERLANSLCTQAMRARGPAVMLGFVRDPESNSPALGAKVSLVYYDTDPIGRKQMRMREAPVDSSGMYRICGLPAEMSGKVQVFRNGVSTGEVPAEVTNFLALRAFSVAATQIVTEVKMDSGKVKRIAKGLARVTGRVMDKTGKPLGGARVTLQGGGETAISRPNGEFALDSLPAGTQALEVRKLGYASADVPVELSSSVPARTTVTLGDFVPVLATMRVEAAQDKALSDVGYLQRKQTGMGYYMDGKMINHESLSFSDVMRVAPGLRVSPLGDGKTYVITDARNSADGCVNFYVDGTFWQTMSPGDIDDFVRPQELVAVEVYHGTSAPPQFVQAGQSGCAAVVAWTVAKVRPKKP